MLAGDPTPVEAAQVIERARRAAMPNALPPEAPLWIVLNQASGSGDAQAVEASLRERLQAAGRRFELLRAGASAVWTSELSLYALDIDPRIYS